MFRFGSSIYYRIDKIVDGILLYIVSLMVCSSFCSTKRFSGYFDLYFTKHDNNIPKLDRNELFLSEWHLPRLQSPSSSH